MSKHKRVKWHRIHENIWITNYYPEQGLGHFMIKCVYGDIYAVFIVGTYHADFDCHTLMDEYKFQNGDEVKAFRSLASAKNYVRQYINEVRLELGVNSNLEM